VLLLVSGAASAMSAPLPETIASGLANTKPVETVVVPAVVPPIVSRWPLPQARLPSRVSLSASVPPAALPTPTVVPAGVGADGQVVGAGDAVGDADGEAVGDDGDVAASRSSAARCRH
jgi:hypothetical protein